MIYTKYRTADGIFLGWGDMPTEEDINLQLRLGEAALIGIKGDPRTQRLDLASGEVVPYTPPPPDPVVPASVSPWQMRRALNQLGVRAQVEAAVAAGDQDTKDGWEFASEFRRDNVLLNAMAGALGMTATDIDNLFTLAATYE